MIDAVSACYKASKRPLFPVHDIGLGIHTKTAPALHEGPRRFLPVNDDR